MKLPGPLNVEQEKQLRTVQLSAKHLLAPDQRPARRRQGRIRQARTQDRSGCLSERHRRGRDNAASDGLGQRLAP